MFLARVVQTFALTATFLAPVAVRADDTPKKGAPSENPPAEKASAKPRRKPDVGYYPTTQDVVEKMLELVRVTKKDHVFDLGCGDGRFMVTASRKYGCRSTGYEINPELIAKGRAEIRKLKLEAIAKIEDQDLFTVDMTPASVAVLFLLPEMNAKLVPQLQKMKPGSRIITHEFHIPGIQPDQELTWISQEDNSEHLLFIYKIPLKPAKKDAAAESVAPAKKKRRNRRSNTPCVSRVTCEGITYAPYDQSRYHHSDWTTLGRGHGHRHCHGCDSGGRCLL